MKSPMVKISCIVHQDVMTAAIGFSFIVPLVIYVKNGPNNMSLAIASKTLLAPMRPFRLALKLSSKVPIVSTTGDKVNNSRKKQSL